MVVGMPRCVSNRLAGLRSHAAGDRVLPLATAVGLLNGHGGLRGLDCMYVCWVGGIEHTY